MTKIVWRAPGSLTYDAGFSNGVLYPTGANGVPWNGFVSMTENVSGGEVESYYFDGVKYLDVIFGEDFQGTLEAFSSPPEFAVSDGLAQVAAGLFASQQPRKPFGLSYRTGVGNDLTDAAGYKIHLLYHCMSAPAEKTYTTLNAEAELATTAWTIYTRPDAAGVYLGNTYKPTAHLVVDSRGVLPARMTGFLDVLYGSSTLNARLPTQQEVVTFLNTGSWT